MALGESLKVLLGADADPLVKDLNRAAREVQKFGKDVKESLDSVRESVATIFGVGITAGALEFAKSTIEAVGALKDQADQIGLNVEKFQELKFAARQAGVDQETMNTALNKLSRLLGEAYDKTSEASKVFKKWAIDTHDAHGNLLPLENVLNQVADRMATIRDPALRSAFAVDVLSKTGPALINFLSDGSAGLHKMGKEARETGAVIDEKFVKQAKEASDKLAALADVISGQLAIAIISLGNAIKTVWSGFVAGIDDLNIDGFYQKAKDLNEEYAAIKARIASLEQMPASADNSDLVRMKKRLAEIRAEAAETLRAIENYKKATAPEPEKTVKSTSKDTSFNPLDVNKAEQAAKNAQDAARAYDEFITKLHEEYALLHLTGAEREKQQKLFEIENQLRRYGVELSQEQRQEVIALASANAKLAEEQKKHKEYMDELKAAGRQLGSEITSAFEDAVVAGKDLGEVFASLMQDIEKMVLRFAILRPLGDAVGGALGDIGGGFFSDLFGGFRAGGGAVSGSKGYVVGERGPEWFVPGNNGSIIPNHQLGGGGGGGSFSPTFNFHVKVDGAAAGDPQAAARAGSSFAMAAKSTILDILVDQRRPGGLLYNGR